MPISSAPPKPKGKYSQAWFDATYRFWVRNMALELLREEYQLSLNSCEGVAPDIVRERQRRYDEHLARLKLVWAEEDMKCEKLP